MQSQPRRRCETKACGTLLTFTLVPMPSQRRRAPSSSRRRSSADGYGAGVAVRSSILSSSILDMLKYEEGSYSAQGAFPLGTYLPARGAVRAAHMAGSDRDRDRDEPIPSAAAALSTGAGTGTTALPSAHIVLRLLRSDPRLQARVTLLREKLFGHGRRPRDVDVGQDRATTPQAMTFVIDAEWAKNLQMWANI